MWTPFGDLIHDNDWDTRFLDGGGSAARRNNLEA
jgi:hypothetical protein